MCPLHSMVLGSAWSSMQCHFVIYRDGPNCIRSRTDTRLRCLHTLLDDCTCFKRQIKTRRDHTDFRGAIVPMPERRTDHSYWIVHLFEHSTIPNKHVDLAKRAQFRHVAETEVSDLFQQASCDPFASATVLPAPTRVHGTSARSAYGVASEPSPPAAAPGRT